MSEPLQEFRNRLRRALSLRGMTQSQLAKTIGVRQATVSQWFNGESPAQPRAEQIIKLPEALSINGHWLLTGEGTMDDKPTQAQVILEGIRQLLEQPRTPPTPEEEGAIGSAARAHAEAARVRQLQTAGQEKPPGD